MKKYVILCLSFIFLIGCTDREIIDDVNIIVGVGFDKVGEDKYKGTFLLQDYKPDQSIDNLIYSSEATINRSVLTDVQKQSSEPLVTGGISFIIFDKKFANEGIVNSIDVFQRDATVGARIFLATSKTNVQQLFEGNYGSRGNGNYIYNLFNHNIRHRDVPRTNLHIFLHDYYQRGKDVYLPQVTQLSEDKMEISGMEVFKDDKIVTFIEKDDMFYFKLLVDKYSSGFFNVRLPDSKEAAIYSIRSKHKIKIQEKDPYKIKISIKMRGVVKEYSGKSLNEKIVKDIEKALQKKIEKECSQLIKRFQEKGTDPIGLGEIAKSRTRNFDYKKWEDNYKNIEITVKADVSIEETGVVD